MVERAAREPMVWTSGDVVAGRFVLEVLAGSGSAGAVFRAWDLERAETVALKLFHRRRNCLERSEREARALSSVRHAGVVRYVAHGCTERSVPFVAMAWIDGETLTDRLRGRGLTPRESLRLALRLSSALAALHAAGIVHRDLKPSNVLLPGGRVERACILDLGVCRDLHDTAATRSDGAYVGTPRYMAPEQIREPESVACRGDVFSLGCILYECLCGEPAFGASGVFAVLAQILFEPAPSVRGRRPELPALLESLLARMLDRRPERRPAAGEVLNARLRAAFALGGLAPLAPPPRSPRPAGSDATAPSELSSDVSAACCARLKTTGASPLVRPD